MKFFSLFFKALRMSGRLESTMYKADSVNSAELIDQLCAEQQPAKRGAALTDMADYPEESVVRLA